MSGTGLIIVMCLSQTLGLLGFATFPALLPIFIDEWQLSGTEAGWLNGIFFLGYTISVPVLVGLTDRVDARRVVLASTALAGATMLGFAFLADGFWTALVLRILTGVGFAGTYMPGLKALTDRIESDNPSRAVAYYTSSYAIGASLSFYLSGLLEQAFDWRWAFGLLSLGSLATVMLVGAVLRPVVVPAVARGAAFLLDFRPVFANRRAVGYILAYAMHSWETFVLIGWVVAFLTFAASLQPDAAVGWNVTLLGAIITLVAMPASVLGNELSIRFGRRRTVSVLMLASAALAGVIGFAATLPFAVVATLCLIYGAATASDSGSLTAGTVGAADPESRGATMAMHSLIGFLGGFIGSLVFGMTLDLVGPWSEVAAWGVAFAIAGLVAALGPLMLWIFAGRA